MVQPLLEKLVNELSLVKSTSKVHNPWDAQFSSNVRRKNLLSYFKKMYTLKPTVLLVGEAPGYRGAGRVGMPFSSEKLVMTHQFFSDRRDFGVIDENELVGEASASIVWKTLDSLNFYPLMWATFPFHPHNEGDALSNRAPTTDEIRVGKKFIEKILKIYKINKIVAVGRIAEKTLTEMGLSAFPVRHPSHGGATQFAEGLRSFVQKA